MVVIFEVCALYTTVLLGQIEDVCAWCLHSTHLGYSHTNTYAQTHPRTYTKKRRGRRNITAYGVYVSATVVSIRVNAHAAARKGRLAWKEHCTMSNLYVLCLSNTTANGKKRL